MASHRRPLTSFSSCSFLISCLCLACYYMNGMTMAEGRGGRLQLPTSLRHQNFGKYHKGLLHHPPRPNPYYKKLIPATPPRYSPPATPPPHQALAVEGVVLCQNCTYLNTSSLRDSKPLPGAKVALACRDIHYKTMVYEMAYTDKQGYFYIYVNDFDFKKHKGVTECRVYLFSSPQISCSKATNINFGIIGAPLTTRQKLYDHKILYSVGPFAFAPSVPCEKSY